MNILPVIVIYQETLNNTQTYQTLRKALADLNQIKQQIFVYDNSPRTQVVTEETIIYQHDPQNGGTAAAYNAALDYANKNDYDWLLLLDQDSELTTEYIQSLWQLKPVKNSETVAFLPLVKVANQQISPVPTTNLRPLKEQATIKPGIYQHEIMGIASGTVIQTTFLEQISGFNQAFPLDYLDHWLFWKIFQEQKQVEVLNEKIHHDLSVLAANYVSFERYQQILKAEKHFYRDYQTKDWPTYKKHLWLRFFKQLLTIKDKRIARLTFQNIFSK